MAPGANNRARTTFEKLAEKLKPEERTIEFDPETWQPTGKNAPNFVSYCNCKAKYIPINIVYWKDVDVGLKDEVWEDIKV